MTDKKKNIAIKETPAKPVAIENNSNPLLVWSCAAVIALITFIAFFHSLQNDFTNWDDPVYVKDNPLVTSNSMPVVQIFETPVSGHYHPLTIVSLAINYRLNKLNPFGYHLVNVIFHIFNTLLVFIFIFLVTRRNLLMASIVALFFGIHPMHVESVTWISERKDVLFVFFFMAALITYLRYTETRKIIWYVFTFLLFILSCLSKEMAIVFPVILLLIDYLKGVKWQWKLIIEKIPFFLIAIVLGVAEFIIQSGNKVNNSNMQQFTFLHRVLFASYAPVMYILKLFVPYKLSAFYPYPGNDIPLVFYLSPLLLLALLVALVYFFRKREKEIVFGLLFYFVSIALVIQFIPINPYIIPDRYTYLSYIGLLFIIAFVINKAWSQQSKDRILSYFKYPFIILVVIATCIFDYQTYARTQVWKNSETLWTNVLANYPNCATAYKALGDYYRELAQPEKAQYNYTKAIQCDSTYAGAYVNRGLLYLKDGKTNLALSDFNKAIACDSTNEEAYNNRGSIYFSNGKIDSALVNYNKAIALKTTSPICYYNRGLIYSSTPDKKDLAIADLTKAIQLDTTYAAAYNNRGLLYLNTGKYNLALDDFTQSIALDSNNASAYSNRAFLYFNRGKNDSVLMDCNKAIAHDPTSALYHFNRGLFYKTIRQFQKAEDDFSSGIALKPQNADAYYYNRGICFASLENYAAAITDFSNAIKLNPTVSDYWLSRAYVEGKAGRIAQANADGLKAQELKQGK